MNENKFDTPDTDISDKKNDLEKVQVFHRINRLKLKANADGENVKVTIDPNNVQKAEQIIETKANLYNGEMNKALETIVELRQNLQNSLPEKELKSIRETLFHSANRAKDLASTFQQSLMSHFAQSLREFIEKFKPENSAHQTIIDAHINVMRIVLDEKLENDHDQKAEELKSTVAKAIEKHS